MSRRRLLVIVGLLLCLQILIGLLIFAIRWPERVPGWGQDGSPTTTTRPAATSTKPPSSQPTSSPHPEIEAINQQIKLLRDGQIAYRVLSPMRVNDLHRVTARVAYVLGSKSALPDTGPVTTTSLPVGPHLRADLSGPDFAITRVGANDEGKRVLADGNYAEWAWDVRPQKSGTRHLDLVVSVLLSEGTSSIYTQTFERSVEVEVNTWYGIGRWLRDYWPLTGLTVPVMGAGGYALYRWVRARRAAGGPTVSARSSPARARPGGGDPPEHWS